MIGPAEFDPEVTPAIHWDGRKWPVPDMPPAQLHIVYEAISEVSKVLDASQQVKLDEAKQAVDDAGAAGQRARLMTGLKLMTTIYDLTGEQYEKMRKVVFYGLKIAHGDLKREEFDAVPTTPREMHDAFRVVRDQSHMYDIRLRKGLPTSGEALAGKMQEAQTGIS